MWFTLSLVTIFFWGGSDLFSKMGTKPSDKYSHWRLVIVVGLVMGLHATGYMLYEKIAFDPMSLLIYLPVSLMYILSMVLGYAGLRYIELSVSSPVCNSSGAVAALLCFIFLGQRMEVWQVLAVVMVSGGLVALAVFERRYARPEQQISSGDKKFHTGFVAFLFPVMYCIIDGVGSAMDAYWLEYYMDESQVLLAYEYTFLLVGILAFVYLRFVRKQRFRLRDEKIFALGALCETAGQFTYTFAMGDKPILAAPMIASYSIVSILLSRLFLKEKLKWPQYAVILVIMAGIAILGME